MMRAAGTMDTGFGIVASIDSVQTRVNLVTGTGHSERCGNKAPAAISAAVGDKEQVQGTFHYIQLALAATCLALQVDDND
jgi:hypothetical protein